MRLLSWGRLLKTLNEVMADHPELNFIGYDVYDLESIERANDDLMKTVYNAPPSPFLDIFQSSDRLMTFEDILASSVDEDDDYQWVRDEGLTSTLDPLQLCLVLASQPLWLVEEPPLEPKPEVNIIERVEMTDTGGPAEEAVGQDNWTTAMEVDIVLEVPANPTREEGKIKVESSKHWIRSSQS